MKHIQTFESFVNESVNENLAMDMLGIFMQALMLSGPVVALGIRNGAFDDLRTPVQVVRDWQKDRIVGPAVERLSQDSDVIAFFQLPSSQQRGKWKELLKTKLTDNEMKYINSISRYRVKDGK